MRPSLTSGRPSRADEPAMRKEQAIASSSPPPSASPSTAATDSAGWLARRSRAARTASPYAANNSASTDAMCLMSAPAAKNPGSAEDTTMTLAGKASAASSAVFSPLISARPNALAGGRLSTISSTDCSACQVTGELLSDSVIDVPPGLRHSEATADRQRLTCDVLGSIGCEERDGGRDVR